MTTQADLNYYSTLCSIDDARIFDEVAQEKVKAHDKHGPQTHPNGTDSIFKFDADLAKATCDEAHLEGELTWFDILQEEFWESAAEEDPAAVRAELIQVMSVALDWIQDIDRKAASQ